MPHKLRFFEKTAPSVAVALWLWYITSTKLPAKKSVSMNTSFAFCYAWLSRGVFVPFPLCILHMYLHL